MKTLLIALFFIASFCNNSARAQLKMTVGQAGINPGTSLYFIAQKEKLFAKHGVEVNIVATTTTAAVQGMLGGSLHLTLGAGPGVYSRNIRRVAPVCSDLFLGERFSLLHRGAQGNR